MEASVIRRNFAQILGDEIFDAGREFFNLVDLVYGDGSGYGFYDVMERDFDAMPFKGLAVDLDDFNRRHFFNFFAYKEARLDDLLAFCEYVYSFSIVIEKIDALGRAQASCVSSHISAVVEASSHELIPFGDVYIAVPKNTYVREASHNVPEELAGELLSYGYRGFKGNLAKKASILAALGKELEPRRAEIKGMAPKIEQEVFAGLNNFNIRHNDLNPSNGSKFKKEFASLSDAEKEQKYDRIYRLCCACFLLLEADSPCRDEN